MTDLGMLSRMVARIFPPMFSVAPWRHPAWWALVILALGLAVAIAQLGTLRHSC